MKYLLALLLTCSAAFGQFRAVDSVAFHGAAADQAKPSGWSPTQISGLVRWFDAQSIVGLNNGDAVSLWTDKTGTTNLTQTEATAQPIYIASDATLGNKPCLYFDGTNDHLTNNSVGASTITLFVVAYATNTTLGTVYTLNFSSSTARITPTGVDKWRYTSTAMTNDGGAFTAAGVEIVRFASTASASTRAQNGTWISAAPNGTYDDANVPAGVGYHSGGTAFKGFIGEVLIYDSALADADVNLVGRYLAGRWNFTWTDL